MDVEKPPTGYPAKWIAILTIVLVVAGGIVLSSAMIAAGGDDSAKAESWKGPPYLIVGAKLKTLQIGGFVFSSSGESDYLEITAISGTWAELTPSNDAGEARWFNMQLFEVFSVYPRHAPKINKPAGNQG